MLKIITVFLFALLLGYFGVECFKRLSNEEKFETLKNLAYFVGLSTVVILLLSGIVFLF